MPFEKWDRLRKRTRCCLNRPWRLPVADSFGDPVGPSIAIYRLQMVAVRERVPE